MAMSTASVESVGVLPDDRFRRGGVLGGPAAFAAAGRFGIAAERPTRVQVAVWSVLGVVGLAVIGVHHLRDPGEHGRPLRIRQPVMCAASWRTADLRHSTVWPHGQSTVATGRRSPDLSVETLAMSLKPRLGPPRELPGMKPPLGRTGKIDRYSANFGDFRMARKFALTLFLPSQLSWPPAFAAGRGRPVAGQARREDPERRLPRCRRRQARSSRHQGP